MSNDLPNFVRPFLWSYDAEQLDLQKDKKLIISNILEYGTKEATDWLVDTYGKDEVRAVIEEPLPGRIGKKSLNYWALVFDAVPGNTDRELH